MTTNALKKWFKEVFNIPVRGRSTGGKHPYFEIRIPCVERKSLSEPMVYAHSFPDELGELCLSIIYKGEIKGPWAGNVGRYCIAMHEEEWKKVVEEWSKLSPKM
jgi:hypothetical protein